MKHFIILTFILLMLFAGIRSNGARREGEGGNAPTRTYKPNKPYAVTDITLRDHARADDIKFISFDPTQVVDHDSDGNSDHSHTHDIDASIICKTVPKSSDAAETMDDFDYFCFSSLENWDVSLTNDTRIDCIHDIPSVDNPFHDIIRVDNPVRDHSCLIMPVYAAITPEDREHERKRILAFMKGSDWICSKIDCIHNNITMYQILDHALRFDGSQFVLGNQHPKLKLLMDLFHFVQEL